MVIFLYTFDKEVNFVDSIGCKQLSCNHILYKIIK